MSTTVDERVLEMRFDNKQFEANVQTSMSTLAKLKQSLNLKGASKGLEAISTAAKNNNISVIGVAADKVGLKFNAMYTMADQALRNITNRVQHTAERMVKALTLEPITTGFQEYETQINAVQTILANTSHNGTTIEQVNKALDELNKYADKTIYNFTEMTRNIGTFTAAGVDLQTSVDSIQGIANLAAVSGSTSQQASTAMYQLSQALAAGKVTLMDWNSVVNAGMGGKVFQDALVRTSELLGTGAKAAIDTYGSFRQSLTQGEWLTTEVLTETLKQFAGAYSEADLIQQGFTAQQAKDIAAMAKTAEDAATKVKTFTQLWDVLKESAQSGWSQTWKLLIGDFEEAKALLTPLADFMTGVINKMSEARNAVLESALANRFKAIGDTIKTITKPIENSAESIGKVVKSVEEYSKVVDEIIGGKWGNGQARWDKLTEAGYDWAHAQNLVNEKLGNAKRHATDYKEAQNGVAEAQKKASESTGEYIAKLVKKKDSELADMGLTFEQIAALRKLETQSKKTGIPIEDLAENIDLLNGRTLLINAFKNAGDGLIGTFKAMKGAWEAVFPPKSTKARAASLYDFIAALHKFSLNLRLTDSETGELTDTAKDLMNTFKGVFAIVDIIATIAGGGLRIAFEVLKGVLKYFNLDILDLTGNIGEAIYEFRNWFKSIINIDGVLEKIIPLVSDGIEAVKSWVKAFLELPQVQKIIVKITGAFDKIKDYDFSNFGSDFIDTVLGWGKAIKGWIDAFKEIPQVQKILAKLKEEFGNIDFKEIGINLIEGIKLGLDEGIDFIVQNMKNLGLKMLDAICEVLGIHSPATEGISIGVNFILGIIEGIGKAIKWLVESVQNVGSVIIDYFKNIDWGINTEGLESAFAKIKEVLGGFDYTKLLAIIPITAVILMVKNIYGMVKAITDGINSINDVLDNFALIEKKFAKVLGALSFSIAMDGVKKLAISLAIMVGSLVVLTLIDTDKLYDAVGVIFVLALILGGLAFAMSKLSDTSAKFSFKDGLDVEGIKASLLSIGAAILLLGITAKMLGSLNTEQYTKGMLGLVGIMGMMVLFVAACKKLGDIKTAATMAKFGDMILKLSIAMILMVGVCKLAGKLTIDELKSAGLFAVGFAGFIGLLVLCTKIAPDQQIAQIGGLVIKLSIAMILMIGVCKLASKLKAKEMIKGGLFALAFIFFVGGLMSVTTLYDKEHVAKLGGLLLSISVSMIIMLGVCKLAAKLKPREMIAGAIFMGAFLGFIAVLTKVTTITNKQQIAKITGTILAISIAIAVLAGVAVLISMVPTDMLVRGVAAVIALGAIMTAMIWATRGANNVVGNLVVMTIAIALLVGAVAVLCNLSSEPGKLKQAVAALVIVMSAFAGIMALTKVIKNSKATRKLIFEMILVVAALALMLGVLSIVANRTTDGSLLEAAASLTLLMLAFAETMIIIGKVGTISKTVEPMLKPMMDVVVKLAIALGILSIVAHFTKDGSMLEAAASLSLLMLAFAKSMDILGNTGAKAKNALPLMGPIKWIIAELAVVLGVLAIVAHHTTDGSLLEAATSLSILLLALSASMVILGYVGPTAKTGVGAAALMGLVIAELAVILGLMAKFNVNPSIETAAALSILLISMSASLILLGAVGMMKGAAFIGIGALAALIIGIGGLIALIGALVTEFPMLEEFLNKGIPILEKIGYAIGSFFGNIIDGFSAGAASGLEKIGEGIGNFLTKISEGAENIDRAAIDNMVYLLKALGGLGLASIVLSVADAFAGKDTTAMEKFETDGKAFFKAIKEIAKEMIGFTLPEDFSAESLITLLGAIKQVGTSMIGLSIADMFTNIVGDETAMEKFKTDGKAFFSAIKAIVPEMTGFSFPEDFSVEGLTTFLDCLKQVGNRMIGLSIADMFTGVVGDETAMEKFETDGKAFFSAIKSIAPEMTGFAFPEDFSVEGLTTLLDILKDVSHKVIGLTISDMFAGKDTTTMEKFETDGKAFFSAIKNISAEMTGFSLPEDFSTKALTTLFDTLNTVKSYTIGASWGDIFTLGGTTMEKFQSDGTTFFSTLKTIASEAGGINISNFSVAETAISKIKDIITSVKGLDYSGVKEFTGIGTGGLGADGPMHDIGKAIKDFSSTVSGINISAVEVSVTAATKLKKLITGLVGLDTSGVSSFNPKSIGEKISAYSNTVSGIDTGKIASSINIANRLKSFITGLSGLDASGVGAFKAAISSLGTISFEGLTKTFSANAGKIAQLGSDMMDGISKGMRSKQGTLIKSANDIVNGMLKVVSGRNAMFAHIAKGLMDHFISGINGKKTQLAKSVTAGLASAITAINGYYTGFYNAGSYVASGFANGISANSYKAAAKASAMAKAAKQAAEEALGIASPSKVFYKIGDYTGMGFIKALTEYSSKAYNVSTDMANSAKGGLTDAISRMYDAINGDIDTQPTIRPVLDLSNIEAGVGTLNGLMSNSSIGVVSNINAISSRMSQRRQNGTNSDVVSAINKLDKHLDNVGGTSYNINGVTYDDGSAIQGALETIVRHAKIERRS